jgi:Leucine-rich repeat (LRR) protein
MLLLLIVVSACGLGWVVHQAREQRLAVRAILARGGVVEYDYQYDAARNRRLPQGKTWRPVWLQKALGDDYFHHVVCVGLDRAPTDVDLVALAGLKHLKLLYLGGGGITDDGLKQLKDLTDLRTLILWGNPISGDGLNHLRGLRKLQVLDLGGTQVTDSQLLGLRNLTGLERLDLPNNPQLTGSFLQHVADLPNLKDFVLRGTGITDFALSYLEKSKNVQSLMLDRTKVTDAGLTHLRGLTSLRSLDLTQSAVTDTGIVGVRGWFPQASVKPLMPGKQ